MNKILFTFTILSASLSLAFPATWLTCMTNDFQPDITFFISETMSPKKLFASLSDAKGDDLYYYSADISDDQAILARQTKSIGSTELSLFGEGLVSPFTNQLNVEITNGSLVLKTETESFSNINCH